MTKMKIGLFGGTFDPIHCGHLNLAFELMEKRNLDQVWFIPAQINPLKTQAPPTPIEHRLAMTQLAIQDIPQFHLKDLEQSLPSPSYTIQTLRAFITEEAKNPKSNQFFLLMGEDTVPGFVHWYLPEEIVKLVTLLIGSRSGIWQYELENFSLPIREAIQEGLTQTRLIDVSGTEIRHRIAQNLYCGHLVSEPVLQYIFQNQIYTQTS